MIKKKSKYIYIISLLLAIFTTFAISFLTANLTKAEINQDSETVLSVENLTLSDSSYEVRFQGFNANNSVVVPTISDPILVVDKEITYVCYD